MQDNTFGQSTAPLLCRQASSLMCHGGVEVLSQASLNNRYLNENLT